MAEPIGMASGLLALATFALQSGIALYETVKSFHSHPKRVRDLIEELEALCGVLAPLTDLVNSTADVDLSAPELPLLRCGNACKEFEEELIKCSSRSGGNRTSFRDWAKLRYMSDDIDGFRRLLAGYKSTINIALADANLRQSALTAESLEVHKDLIETAKSDLEAHLESIDGKIELLFAQTAANTDSDTSEMQLLKEERLSTEKCLQICAQLSDHINQIQLVTQRSSDSAEADTPDALSERLTNEGLEECKTSITRTTAKLERHMQDIMNRLLSKSRRAMTNEAEFTELARLRDEWETVRQCIDICSRADNHLKENISKVENYGTGDAVQFMVSTGKKTIHGKNRGLGWRTRQVAGHLSDASLQQISRDMTSINLQYPAKEGPPLPANTHSDPVNGVESERTSEFRER
ncbi:hypothetical protein MPDQ_005479, partial [Monascus purpureus]